MGADAVSGRSPRWGDLARTVALAAFAGALVAGGAGCGSTSAAGTGTGGAGGRGGAGTGGASTGAAGTGGATGTGGGAGASGAAGTGGGASGMGGRGGAGMAGGTAGTGGGGTGGGAWRIPVPTSPVRGLAVAGQRACALSPDGIARCWGGNTDLVGLVTGTNFPLDHAAPVEMTPLLGQHIVDIGFTDIDVCALKDEGSVFCNGKGNSLIVTGIGGPAVQICVGWVSLDFAFGCALRADGAVFCWGDSNGTSVNPLGDSGGQFWSIEAPGVDDAVGIACGSQTACAVKRDGTAWCWGGTRGTPYPYPMTGEAPRPLPELGSDIATLQAGEGGICAFSRSGAATCFGVLFTPSSSTTPLPPPRAVPELDGASALAIGNSHVCAAGADGRVRCWGANDFGQLGDGTFVAHTAPALATTLGGSGAGGASAAMREIAAGDGVTCASFGDGAVRCVGRNDRGQLGDGSALSLAAVPVALASGSSVASYQAAGTDHAASALLSDGSVVAWGAIPPIALPAAPGGPPLRAAAPVAVAAPPAVPAAVQASVTSTSACLRTAGGTVRCLDTAPPTGTPASFHVVPGLETGALDLEGNCAVPAGGGVTCNIGLAGVTPSAAPGTAGMGAVAALGIGYSGGCVVRPDGNVECWSALVGNPTTTPIQGLGGRAVAVAVGDDACALRDDGAVVCTPLNGDIIQLPAAAVGVTAASGVFCQQYPWGGLGCRVDDFHGHACAWTAAGDLYCWGRDNTYGQLGDGTTTTTRTGAAVHVTAPGGPVISASAGNRQTCAVRAADRKLVCWGWNGAGELGTGTGGPRATSTAVALP
jgi:alpha-tubulin suppressor-like RCC1 family protein